MRSRSPWILLGLAAAVRAVVAVRTAIPGRDSAGYLWLADQVRERGIGAAFETAFHPLYPLLVALVPGETVTSGKLVAGGLGALAILPLFALGERLFGRVAAAAACFLYAVGIWFARHPADCLSEGPFYLWVALAVWLLSRPRPAGWAVGVVAGLAFATRPEGASLVLLGVPWLWLRGERSAALAAGAAFGAVAGLCSLGYWAAGMGFVLTPKLAFNYEVGIGAAEGSAIGHYLGHLVQVPGELCEALGYFAAPLALWGIWRARPWRDRDIGALILALFLLQVAVIPFLRSHFRFLSGYGFLLLVFAGRAWIDVRPRMARFTKPVQIMLVCVVVAGDLVRIPQERRGDRRVFVPLGRWLEPRLGPRSRLVTEMIPRLEYFAGVKPAPNRPLTRQEVLEACRPSDVGYAVFIRGRTGITLADLERLDFVPARLPADILTAADARGMVVCERQR